MPVWYDMETQIQVSFSWWVRVLLGITVLTSSLCGFGLWYGLPRLCSGKEPLCQCKWRRRWEFDPQVGKIPQVRTVCPLQDSCLGSPVDRGAWWVTVHRVTNSRMWLSTDAYMIYLRPVSSYPFLAGAVGVASWKGLDMLLLQVGEPALLSLWLSTWQLRAARFM